MIVLLAYGETPLSLVNAGHSISLSVHPFRVDQERHARKQ